jgi:hypothetical protein
MANETAASELRTNRRDFVVAGAGLSAAVLAGVASSESVFADQKPHQAESKIEPLFAENDIVLFQGDSITDAGRNREKAGDANAADAMGKGYAWMAASQLLV